MCYAIVLGIRRSWVCPNGRHCYRRMQARLLSQGVGRSGGEPGAVAMQCGARVALLFAARTEREWRTVAEARVPVYVTGSSEVDNDRQSDCVAGSGRARGVGVSEASSSAAWKHKQFQHRPLAAAATQPASKRAPAGSAAANLNCRSLTLRPVARQYHVDAEHVLCVVKISTQVVLRGSREEHVSGTCFPCY